MNRRQRLCAIAVLALAACPALAEPEALRCATLTPESFTVAEFAALERDAPVLHGYLESGSFGSLDARQRFHLVSQATTGADWHDVSLPLAYHPAVTGTDGERDAVMGAYTAACDNLLNVQMDSARTLEGARAILDLTDVVKAAYQADLVLCTEIEKCQYEYRECKKRAAKTRDDCIKAANEVLEIALDECQFEYDQAIKRGDDVSEATIELHKCNGKATAKNILDVAECGVEYVEDLAVCTFEVGQCMLRAGLGI